jgi:hypothetical protein
MAVLFVACPALAEPSGGPAELTIAQAADAPTESAVTTPRAGAGEGSRALTPDPSAIVATTENSPKGGAGWLVGGVAGGVVFTSVALLALSFGIVTQLPPPKNQTSRDRATAVLFSSAGLLGLGGGGLGGWLLGDSARSGSTLSKAAVIALNVLAVLAVGACAVGVLAVSAAAVPVGY